MDIPERRSSGAPQKFNLEDYIDEEFLDVSADTDLPDFSNLTPNELINKLVIPGLLPVGVKAKDVKDDFRKFAKLGKSADVPNARINANIIKMVEGLSMYFTGADKPPEKNKHQNRGYSIGLKYKDDAVGYNLGQQVLTGTVENNTLSALFRNLRNTKGLLQNEPDAHEKLRDTITDSIQYENGIKRFLAFREEFKNAFYRLLVIVPEKVIGPDGIERNARNPINRVMDYMLKDIADDPRIDFSDINNREALLDDNTITALALSAYEWIGNRAKSNLFNDDNAINSLLFRDTRTEVLTEEREAFQDSGVQVDFLAERLGKRTVRNIGIEAREELEGHLHTALENELGAMIVAVLIEAGYLESKPVSYVDIARAKERDKANGYIDNQTTQEELANPHKKYEGVEVLFARTKGTRRELDPKVQSIEDTFHPEDYQESTAAKKIGEALLGKDEFDSPAPSYEPVKEAPNRLNNSKQKTSEVVKEAIVEHNSVPKLFNMPVLNVFNYFRTGDSIDAEMLIVMAGGKREKTIVTKHIDEANSLKSKNEGLYKEYEKLFQFADDMEKQGKPHASTEFFLSGNPWKQYRTGYNENISPLLSKIHRAAIKDKAWEHEYKNDAERTLFRLAIAQGLGIDIDKQTVTTSLKDLDKKLGHEKIVKAVESIRALKNRDPSLTPEAILQHKVNINNGVVEAGEDIHSLQALIEQEEHGEAIEEGKPFTSSFTIETDGITNGTAFGLMILGANADPRKLQTMLARTGIFEDGTYQSFGEFKEKGHLDTYQTTGRKLIEDVKELDSSIRNSNLPTRDFIFDTTRPEYRILQETVNSNEGRFVWYNYRKKDANFVSYLPRIEGEDPADTKQRHLDYYDSNKEYQKYWDEIRAIAHNILISSTWAFGDILENENTARALVKDPSMIYNYGAGARSLKNNLARDRIQEVYEKIVEVSRKGTRQEYDILVNHLSWLTSSPPYKGFYTYNKKTKKKDIWASSITQQFPFRYKNIHLRRFTEIQKRRFSQRIDATYGNALVNAMEETTGALRAQGDKLNELYRVAFQGFNILYSRRVNQERARLGVRQLSDKRKRRIITELNKVRPVFIGPLAKTPDEGVDLVKYKRERANPTVIEESGYHSVVHLNKPIEGFTNIKVTGEYYILQDPGVSSMPLIIQYADATQQYNSIIGKLPAINIHDASVKSVRDALLTDSEYNKNFLDTAWSVKPVQEVNGLLERIYEELTESDIRSLNESFSDDPRSSRKSFEEFMIMADEFATEVEQHHTNYKNKKLLVTQYHNERVGGYYYNPDEEFDAGIDASNQEILDDTAELTGDVLKRANVFASTPDPLNIKNIRGDEVYKVNRENLQEIFGRLVDKSVVKDSDEHQERLSQLMTRVQNSVADPLTVLVDEADNETRGAILGAEIYIENSASQVKAPLNMSLQEVFAHEVVHSVTEYGIDSGSIAAKELRRFFEDTEKALIKKHGKDAWKIFLDNPGQANNKYYSDKAKAIYDYIFNNTSTQNGKNAYLHEFAAFGTTNEKLVNELQTLEFESKAYTFRGDNVYDKIVNLVNDVLNTIYAKIGGASRNKETPDKVLLKLVSKLADIRQKKEGIIDRLSYGMNTAYSHANTALINYIARPILDITVGETPRKLYGSVPLVGGVVSDAAQIVDTFFKGEEHRHQFRKGINRLNRAMTGSVNNLGTRLLNEIGGTNRDSLSYIKLSRESNKVIDQASRESSDNLTKHLNESFRFGEPSEEEKVALTKLILENDLSVLIEDYSWKEIVDLVNTDTDKVKEEINKLVKQIEEMVTKEEANFILKSTKSLGNKLVTGKFTEVDASLNANLIATMYWSTKKEPANSKDLEPIIDKLATLYALDLQENQREILYKLMQREFEIKEDGTLGNTDNGFTFGMEIHKDNKKQSLTNLFSNDPKLMIKGYTKEQFNEHHEMIIVGVQDIEFYKSMGFAVAGKLERDPLDELGQKYTTIMINKDGAMPNYMAGIVSLQDLKIKGERVGTIQLQAGNEYAELYGGQTSRELTQKRRQQIKRMFSSADTSTDNSIFVPVYSTQRKEVEYRYLLDEHKKESLLGKQYDFSRILGNMEATAIRKVESPKINKKLVEAVHADYLKNYLEEKDEFVLIGRDSKDPDMKELYFMMPEDMKKSVEEIWDREGMFVRKDSIPIIFGQRKFSAAHYFADKRVTNRKLGEEVHGLVELIWKIGSHGYTRKGEFIWKEIVSYAKDSIVVKGVQVLIENILSNNLVLWNYGVPSKDIIKYKAEGIRLLNSYTEDREKLLKLQRELSAKSGIDRERHKTLIARLEDRLNSNPIHELIDEGMMQTIVEDLATTDEFTYRGKIGEFLDAKTDWMPQAIKDAAGNLFATRESAVFKFLNRTTQMSDFVARYAAHKSNLEKGKDREKSIEEIDALFVNYDYATHKGVQYLNDMGIIMFTKYFFRIQQVILFMLTQEPARFVATMLFLDMFGHISNIYDSFMFAGLPGNGFNAPWDIAAAMFMNNPFMWLFM
jgi:hypothetical protein